MHTHADRCAHGSDPYDCSLCDAERACKHGNPSGCCFQCIEEPCAHGVAGFEDCADCAAEHDAQIAECERLTGHDWIDHSHAGPDSGSIDMTCRNCGSHFHHVMY